MLTLRSKRDYSHKVKEAVFIFEAASFFIYVSVLIISFLTNRIDHP